MFSITLGKLAQIVGGRLKRGNPRTPVKHAVYGQTSQIRPGVVYFMHTDQRLARQLAALRQKSCTAVVAPPRWESLIPAHHRLIVTPHVYRGLWELTRWQRNQSRAVFIGVTGSAGKTTTKEMLASILMQKYRVLKSYANYNVAQALPYNLMNLGSHHQAVVLEMGMASLGNIRKQCQYAKPSIGVVTNVGEAHVGSLGNSLDNVVRAKQELVDGIRPGGTLIINADDPGSRKLRLNRFQGRILTFGIQQPAHIRATHIQYTTRGMRFLVNGVSYEIPTWGKHNVYNALAAIAVARIMKVPTASIQRGLSRFPVPYMRLQRLRGIRNFLLINDAYNANPTAMVAGLHVLKQISGGRPTVAVLGNMSALGTLSVPGHRRVGQAVARLNPTRLITIGSLASHIAAGAADHGYPRNRIASFNNQAQAYQYILQSVPAGAILYFKASHNVHLETLVKKLRPPKGDRPGKALPNGQRAKRAKGAGMARRRKKR
ncbi:UDP-N-acetylmuramoyl-tripeptide--D-alanyl-D-alanine ligase [Polycladomyces sp. WAk]|uniref:UDP-N-acetylmuramoyl-tripeptide--D-alanyl-D-alanine ligase n=1 Tax=Polycladomyces zharkentensis TaxID=2807616 RepID=A0ABS2WIU7_9BACL|nr:UDP-N-acetylmuramoyl-tripeptide--D-alanyl-D-alanine ligase [Polycladomyces sp. WAk]MBN2909478.1 UDP-N-acetylmuramoyl-tripeptide--D-alanyl-D-alanine ligase [Polycladomyces sp. WAk]